MKRICAGLYVTVIDGREYQVKPFIGEESGDLRGRWMWRSAARPNEHSDPFPTKREALADLRKMAE